jgi:predicted Ser/Thr protein kinase
MGHIMAHAMTEPCLTDDEVLAFAAGALSGPDLDAAHAHVDRCEDCRQLVAEAGKAHHETAPELAGRNIDRYQVERALGAGGMAIVYLAEDTQLHRKVALKVPRVHAGDGQARMLAEARAMARLAHPNVVAVYEAGTFDAHVFVAMEFVDGITLAAWMRQRERTWREVLEVLRDAGRGLAAAHAAGLVHRDFKPENVLIDRDGRVRVSDFGLAHALETSSEASPGGTPSYMAPEQLDGATGDVRSDQFSFCVTLYEALYGHRVVSSTATTIANAHAFAAAPEPPRGGAVPAWLRRVLERGLARDPALRFTSMEELLGELAPPRRSRAVLATVAALGVAALALAFVASRRSHGESPASAIPSCGPPPSDVCGPEGFCSFIGWNSCGGAGAPGMCSLRPRADECPQESKPVCACDGKTYENMCLARASGTGWDHYGDCHACSGDHPCGSKQYCRYPEGATCGSAGVRGLCMQRPYDCLHVDAPVCGCDGTTYRNTCEAHAAGASIAHGGSC